MRPQTPTTSLPRLDAHGKPMMDDKMHIQGRATKFASRTLSATSRFRNVIMRICKPLLQWGRGFSWFGLMGQNSVISNCHGGFEPCDHDRGYQD